MRAHEVIQKARVEAGISEAEAAANGGLSIYEYGDIEGHADEFTTAISLSAARSICRVLQLNLAELLALEPLPVVDSDVTVGADLVGLSRSTLLRRRRESLGLSIGEVADAIGFEDSTIERVETDNGFLETLPIHVIAELAKRLSLPLGSLIIESY